MKVKTLEHWNELKPRRRRSQRWNNFVYIFRFTNLESESSRALERAQAEEKKITELEEELRVVGSNLQQLEVEKNFKTLKVVKISTQNYQPRQSTNQ